MSEYVQRRLVNAADAPQTTARRYSQAVEVGGVSRTLFISGQIPVDAGGHLPDDFEAQARLAWGNVERQLKAAGMTLDHLVKVTVFLADYDHHEENARVRWDVMGDRMMSLSTVIAGPYDPNWLIEIEAIAVA